MPLVVYGLVAISTLSHAYWNFVLKRSGGGAAFIGLSKVVEVVVFAPVFIVLVLAPREPIAGATFLVVVGAALVLANYVALARSYALTDLSLAYPVSRGAALLFLPLLGFLVFDERLSIVGVVALALIVAGIVAIQLPRLSWSAVASFSTHLRSPGVMFAILAAAATAAYTVWDKRAVNAMPAFLYFYAYTLVVALVYVGFLLRRGGAEPLRAEWRDRRWPIVQVGVLNTATYMLVLIALRAGTSSYVIGVRQLSIVWGVFLGHRLLGESLEAPRRLGVGLLVAGCILVAVSR